MMTLLDLLFLIHYLPGSSSSESWDVGINRLPCPLSSSRVSLKGGTDRSSQVRRREPYAIISYESSLPGHGCVCVLVTQSCPTLCDPMNCSSPGSSVHGILQARVLEWVAISFSRAGHDWQ